MEKFYERTYLSYSHHIDTPSGPGYSELNEATTQKCLFEFKCECDKEAEEDDKNQAGFCSGSPEGTNRSANAGTEVNVQTPDSTSSSCGAGE